MPNALPVPSAPISPATPPNPPGAVPTDGTPLSCGCGGLWETEGGVEREEVEPLLLWPPHDVVSWGRTERRNIFSNFYKIISEEFD